MKCAECVSAERKSIVTEHGTVSTLMAPHTFFDEDGQYHRHDPNSYTHHYSCSNGHRWQIKRTEPCTSTDCPFGKDDVA